MPRLLEKLTGGDRRSIGRSEEVVAEVLADLALQEPALLPKVLPLLQERVEHGSSAARSRGKKLLKQLARRR